MLSKPKIMAAAIVFGLLVGFTPLASANSNQNITKAHPMIKSTGQINSAAKQTYLMAIRQANTNYKNSVKAARTRYLAALHIAKTQFAKKAAATQYRVDLRSARSTLKAARAVALANFKAAIK